MAKEKGQYVQATKEDVAHFEEWETTRRMYSQLCLLGTMQYLLLLRLQPRFAMHRLHMTHEQKQLITRTMDLLGKAAKNLELQDYMASGLGKGGEQDFVKMNTTLAREGYEGIRLLLNWQNATRHGLTPVEEIEKYINGLSTGHKRWFTKKLIDTFRLQEDK